MAKQVTDIVLDQSLNYIKNNVTEMRAVSGAGAPADRAAAVTATLAVVTGLTSTDFTGPADGDTNGRKLTVNLQNGDTVDSSGDATHISLCSGTTQLYVTTCTTQTLTAGNTLNYPAWDIEIADPT